MWNRELYYIDNLKRCYPKYKFKKKVSSKEIEPIILPTPNKIDFSILYDPEKYRHTLRDIYESKFE